jgi:hypothetical protein
VGAKTVNLPFPLRVLATAGSAALMAAIKIENSPVSSFTDFATSRMVGPLGAAYADDVPKAPKARIAIRRAYTNLKLLRVFIKIFSG